MQINILKLSSLLGAGFLLGACQTGGNEASTTPQNPATVKSSAVGDGPCAKVTCLITGHYLFEGKRYPFEARIDGTTGYYRDIGRLARGSYKDPIISADKANDGTVSYSWNIDGYVFGDLARTNASVLARVGPNGSAEFFFNDEPVFDRADAYMAKGIEFATIEGKGGSSNATAISKGNGNFELSGNYEDSDNPYTLKITDEGAIYEDLASRQDAYQADVKRDDSNLTILLPDNYRFNDTKWNSAEIVVALNDDGSCESFEMRARAPFQELSVFPASC